MVLAFAAGLLLRNLIAAQTGAPGYDPEHVLALELVLPSSYRGPQPILAFYDRLQQDLRALPGVQAVGLVNCPPSAGDCGDWFYSVLDRPAPQLSEVPITLFNTADPRLFRSAANSAAGRTRVHRARPRRNVAIVNETFARKWWPRASGRG